MAYLYSWLNNFDGIVKTYEAITPIRGKRAHADIRPLRRRSKCWERIIKVDDNTYALSDGHYTYRYGERPEAMDEQRETLLETAPIIWTRREDGDYIKIRSNPNQSGSWSRYKFLDDFLPNELRHHFDRNGNHFIRCNGEDHYLPKYVRLYTYDSTAREHQIVVKEDKYLEFKVEGNKFVRANDSYSKSVRIVNKEVTKQYSKAIRELWAWGMAVLPVFGDTLRVQRHEASMKLFNGNIYGWQYHITPEALRAWLSEPEEHSEERLAFLMMAVFKIEAVSGFHHDSIRFEPGERSYERFRHLCMKIGDMFTSKEVEMR